MDDRINMEDLSLEENFQNIMVNDSDTSLRRPKISPVHRPIASPRSRPNFKPVPRTKPPTQNQASVPNLERISEKISVEEDEKKSVCSQIKQSRCTEEWKIVEADLKEAQEASRLADKLEQLAFKRFYIFLEKYGTGVEGVQHWHHKIKSRCQDITRLHEWKASQQTMRDETAKIEVSQETHKKTVDPEVRQKIHKGHHSKVDRSSKEYIRRESELINELDENKLESTKPPGKKKKRKKKSKKKVVTSNLTPNSPVWDVNSTIINGINVWQNVLI